MFLVCAFTAVCVLALGCGDPSSCETCGDSGGDAGATDSGEPPADAGMERDSTVPRDTGGSDSDAGAGDSGTGADGGETDGGTPPMLSCAAVPGTCDDGVDDDGDGFVDCADSDCATACADRSPPAGMYERMGSAGFDEPYRFELRSDGTCQWRTSRLPETWIDCTYTFTAPNLRFFDSGGTLEFDWVVLRQEGDALRMHPAGRDWEDRDYGRATDLDAGGTSGVPAQYVALGSLEDGAINPVHSAIAGGFEASLVGGDRIAISNRGAREVWMWGPRVSPSDPGPLLAASTETLAGFDVVAEAPADGVYLVVARGTIQPHRFDAAGRAYRYLLGDGRDIDGGYSTSGAAIGEVTGDARTDVVVAVGSEIDFADDCSLLIYDQRPDGTLTDTPTALRFADSCYSREAEDIEIHDLDENGHDDVVLLANQTIYVSLASSAGTLGAFYEASEGFAGLWFRMVVFHDDMDGAPDIALVSNGRLRVLGNDGAGRFTVRREVAVDTGGRHGIARGDIDGDGRDDVLIVSGQGGHPFFNIVLGGASTEMVLSGYMAPGVGLVGGVGNLDCDPGAEVVLGDHDLPFFSVAGDGSMARLGDANPRTGAWGLLGFQSGIFVRDLDGDGRAELAQSTRNGLQLWFRTEAGWRRADYDFPNPLNYEADEMSLGDFDDDGCIDAVVPSFNLGTVFLRGFGCR